MSVTTFGREPAGAGTLCGEQLLGLRSAMGRLHPIGGAPPAESPILKAVAVGGPPPSPPEHEIDWLYWRGQGPGVAAAGRREHFGSVSVDDVAATGAGLTEAWVPAARQRAG